MRLKILLVGAILLVVGVYMVYSDMQQGIMPFSASTTYVTTESQKPMLVTVDVNGFSYLSTPLSIDNLRSIQVSYTATGNVSFYVMDQTQFETWKNGIPTDVQLSVLSARVGNFTLNLDHGGTYYFVFDNRASSSLKSVIFNLSEEVVVVEPTPPLGYLPPVLVIVGAVLVGFGLQGKKKPASREQR